MSNKQKVCCLKDRFLAAVVSGDLGSHENRGVVVTLKEFKFYFSHIKTDYVNSFLPAATLEPGRSFVTYTKYLLRIRSGVYLIRQDVIDVYIEQQLKIAEGGNEIKEIGTCYDV